MTQSADPAAAKAAATARLAALVERKRAGGASHTDLNGKGVQSRQAAQSRSLNKSKPALRK
jgi:hypothetical protein